MMNINSFVGFILLPTYFGETVLYSSIYRGLVEWQFEFKAPLSEVIETMKS